MGILREQQLINGELVEGEHLVHCTLCDNECELCADENTFCTAQDVSTESNQFECPKCGGVGDFETSVQGPNGNPIGGFEDCSYCDGTGTVSAGKWERYYESV